MIDDAEISAILSQYSKHSWILRRVLISDKLRRQISDECEMLFGSAELVFSDIDALWFSRSSRPKAETWELRGLGTPPYALDVFFDDGTDATTREEILENAEDRLRRTKSLHASN
jgi:hypothetical protein